MADMRNIAVTIMFFGAILSGFLLFQGEVMSAFGVSSDTQALDDLSDDVNARTQQAEGDLEDKTRNVDSGLEAGLFYLRSVLDAILILFNLFLAIPSIAATFIAELNLPPVAVLLASIPFVYALITLIKEARRSG